MADNKESKPLMTGYMISTQLLEIDGCNRCQECMKWCPTFAVRPDRPGITPMYKNAKWRVLTEPLACVLNSISNASMAPGDDVLIIGGGVMGLLHVMVAKLRGAYTILSEPNPERRKWAQDLGCHLTLDPTAVDLQAEIAHLTEGRGVNTVINTTAIPAVAEQALGLLAKGGVFVMYSSQHPDAPIKMSPNWVHNTEVVITGAVNPSTSSFDQAVRMINKGIIRPGRFVTAEFNYKDCQQAFEAAIDPKNYRVMITF